MNRRLEASDMFDRSFRGLQVLVQHGEYLIIQHSEVTSSANQTLEILQRKHILDYANTEINTPPPLPPAGGATLSKGYRWF